MCVRFRGFHESDLEHLQDKPKKVRQMYENHFALFTNHRYCKTTHEYTPQKQMQLYHVELEHLWIFH